MSDVFYTSGFIFLGTVVTAVVTIITARTAAKKLSGIEKTGKDTHTLVNSNMGAQLKLTAVATKRIAALTNDPLDIEAAAIAENLLADHVRKQAIVDSGADQ